ncbi:MAG TPA: hypothetical protein VFX38_04375, partial [Gammaproteobacteria bacterium]|nr:hypothetical protein [Gammaproteobacteria bacterium]
MQPMARNKDTKRLEARTPCAETILAAVHEHPIMRNLWIGMLFAGVSACAQAPATATITPASDASPARGALQNKARAAVAASSVSFYVEDGDLPPYELIKRLSVSGIGGCTNATKTMKLLIEAKTQAAALGANGVLLQLHGTMSSGMTIVKGNRSVFSVAQYAGSAPGGST